MALVKNSELVSANGSAMITLLEQTSEQSIHIASKLEQFINNSKTILTGGGYDAVRMKLSVYFDALLIQSRICDILPNNVTSANNMMINYMSGYDELDNSKIGEIDQEISNAQRTIDWLKEEVVEYTYNNKGEVISSYTHTRGDSSLIESWEGIKRELIKLKKLLEGLTGADDAAYVNIKGIESDIEKYIISLNGISNNSFSNQKCKSSKNIQPTEELQAEQINLNKDSALIDEGENVATTLSMDDPKKTLVATNLSSNGVAGDLHNGNKAVYYLQEDPQWQDTKWHSEEGNGLAIAGCGPTSTASALATVLGDPSITPKTIADRYPNSGTSTNIPYTAAKEAGLDVSDNIFTSEKEAFDAVLESGGVAVFKAGEEVPRSGGIRYYGGHYIAILDHDPVTDQYTICDPYSEENSSRTWSYSEITNGINNNWSAVIAPPGKTVKGILEENNITPRNGIDGLYN